MPRRARETVAYSRFSWPARRGAAPATRAAAAAALRLGRRNLRGAVCAGGPASACVRPPPPDGLRLGDGHRSPLPRDCAWPTPRRRCGSAAATAASYCCCATSSFATAALTVDVFRRAVRRRLPPRGRACAGERAGRARPPSCRDAAAIRQRSSSTPPLAFWSSLDVLAEVIGTRHRRRARWPRRRRAPLDVRSRRLRTHAVSIRASTSLVDELIVGDVHFEIGPADPRRDLRNFPSICASSVARGPRPR